MSGKEQNATRRWARRIEYAFLACGLMLLTFLGAALVQNILSSRAALRRFGALDAATSASADSIGGEGGRSPSLGVDFSLWDEKRIQTYSTSLTKDFDTPLAVLRISKMRDTSLRRRGQQDGQANR
jgi:hypothetical protein